jgi:hypothetical protein
MLREWDAATVDMSALLFGLAPPIRETCGLDGNSKWPEQKAFVKPETERRGEKTFRFYPDREVEKIRAIWKYLRQGFRYRAAYERALEELKQPKLL